MSKIIWLNDFLCINEDDTTETDAKKKGKILYGGAENTISMFIKKGRELGHTIKLMCPQNFNMDEVKSADLIILSNVSCGFKLSQFDIKQIDWIVENKEFVKLEHDATFCKYRNVECDEYCSMYKCHPYWHRKMFMKAKQVIFLSPLQLKLHLRFFWKELGSEKYITANTKEITDYEDDWSHVWQEMKNDKVHCIPPCIKKSVMIESPEARMKGKYCVVGAIYEGKGIRDILEQYQALGKDLRFIGAIADNRLANMITQAGHTIVPPVPYDKMASVLQKYSYMLISRRIPKTTTLPDGQVGYLEDEEHNRLFNYMNESFSRIIPEALNCGVKILVDKDSKKHIGAYSYGKSDAEICDMCDASDSLLWSILK